jgi:hypothetical protein
VGEESRLIVASGTRRGFTRAGTTVGGVLVTGREPGCPLLRHRGPRNRFEIEAGLEDGGYAR